MPTPRISQASHSVVLRVRKCPGQSVHGKDDVGCGEHLATADGVDGSTDTRATIADTTSAAEKAAKNQVLDIPRS